jgi:hypothetical protein
LEFKADFSSALPFFIFFQVQDHNNMQGSSQNILYVDRRSGTDRRNHSGINIRALLIGGRRTNIRRQDDKRKILLVDRYSTKLFAAIMLWM